MIEVAERGDRYLSTTGATGDWVILRFSQAGAHGAGGAAPGMIHPGFPTLAAAVFASRPVGRAHRTKTAVFDNEREPSVSLPGAIRSPLAWWIGLPILLIGWTGGIVYFARSWSSPDRVIAGLEAQFAKVERDESRPGRPLVGVDLKSIPVEDVDWGGLSTLKDLRKLSTRATPDSGLVHLAGLAGLRELHLNCGSAITDEGLIHLKDVTNPRGPRPPGHQGHRPGPCRPHRPSTAA